jgi:hypothetical protein
LIACSAQGSAHYQQYRGNGEAVSREPAQSVRGSSGGVTLLPSLAKMPAAGHGESAAQANFGGKY